MSPSRIVKNPAVCRSLRRVQAGMLKIESGSYRGRHVDSCQTLRQQLEELGHRLCVFAGLLRCQHPLARRCLRRTGVEELQHLLGLELSAHYGSAFSLFGSRLDAARSLAAPTSLRQAQADASRINDADGDVVVLLDVRGLHVLLRCIIVADKNDYTSSYRQCKQG